jgi:dihydroorotase
MAELYDMYNSGAIGFTDDKNSIENAQLFTSILQYANNFGAKLFHYACDKNISHKTIGHEGLVATSIGFKGQPAIAEDVIIARDITIAEYYNLPIHFSTISTSGAVALIRDAKAKGIKVTCDVAAHQIFFSDIDLKTFDTNLKVLPPFRDDNHKNALIAGLIDGTIDAICSDHTPQNIENKFVEFDHAHFGISSIESAFSMANSVLKNQISINQIIQKFTNSPASIINIKTNCIDVRQPANITLFNPELKYVFSKNSMKSKGKNSPLDGCELLGKPLQVIC